MHPLYATWEHLIPISLGGCSYVKEFGITIDNLALAHQGCNSRRGNNLMWDPVIPISNMQERAIRFARYKQGLIDSLEKIV